MCWTKSALKIVQILRIIYGTRFTDSAVVTDLTRALFRITEFVPLGAKMYMSPRAFYSSTTAVVAFGIQVGCILR